MFLEEEERTLDRNRLFARLQQTGESLHHFRHALNGLAALCDFGDSGLINVRNVYLSLGQHESTTEIVCRT